VSRATEYASEIITKRVSGTPREGGALVLGIRWSHRLFEHEKPTYTPWHVADRRERMPICGYVPVEIDRWSQILTCALDEVECDDCLAAYAALLLTEKG